MRPPDLPAVMLIERRSFTAPWEETTFHALMRRPSAALLVAEAEGRLVGYAVLWFAADEGELGDLAVHPEARRRGVGREIVRACLEEARRRGARSLFLEVRSSNLAARGLYEGMGFRTVGLRKAYYASPVEDAVVMRLDVQNSVR